MPVLTDDARCPECGYDYQWTTEGSEMSPCRNSWHTARGPMVSLKEIIEQRRAMPFLESVNDLQRDSIRALREVLRGAHFVNVMVRTGGRDLHYEADWLRDAIDRLCDQNP